MFTFSFYTIAIDTGMFFCIEHFFAREDEILNERSCYI